MRIFNFNFYETRFFDFIDCFVPEFGGNRNPENSLFFKAKIQFLFEKIWRNKWFTSADLPPFSNNFLMR